MTGDAELLKKILEVMDSAIRPSLNFDGGDISFMSFDGRVLTVQLQGACAHCPRATETLKDFVEQIIRKNVSNDIEVRAV
jgi:Fe-S cluster biogenesis protein NfuA